MSYDLMVFRAEAAPKEKKEFIQWYNKQTEWAEELDYNNPENASPELQNWFMEMIKDFPPMNGPLVEDKDDDEYFDNPKVTDYSIGRDIIYAAFAWSEAQNAYKQMTKLAGKHNVGFFDASGSGKVFIPDGKGNLITSAQEPKKPWWKFW